MHTSSVIGEIFVMNNSSGKGSALYNDGITGDGHIHTAGIAEGAVRRIGTYGIGIAAGISCGKLNGPGLPIVLDGGILAVPCLQQ